MALGEHEDKDDDDDPEYGCFMSTSSDHLMIIVDAKVRGQYDKPLVGLPS